MIIMDSTEEYCYEVPIINHRDTGHVHTVIDTRCLDNKEAHLKDDDCTIIDPEIIPDLHYSKGYSSNEENDQLSNLTEECLDDAIPITSDDDSGKDSECPIIDLDKIDEIKTTQIVKRHSETVFSYDEIYKENKLLIELIEKCLDMENSNGMLRIINRTLIPIYKSADELYKKSDMFVKILSQTLKKLDTVPEKKFLHLKDLCEMMKNSKIKKRASLLTLKTNLNGKFSKSKTRLPDHHIPRKKKKNDVINLDIDDVVDVDCNSDMDITITDVRTQVIDNTSSSVHVINDFDAHVVIDTESDSENQISKNLDHHSEKGCTEKCGDVQVNKRSKKGAPVIHDNSKRCNGIGNDRSDIDNRTATRNTNVELNSAMKQKQLNPNEEINIVDLSNDDDGINNSNKALNTVEKGPINKSSFPLPREFTIEHKIMLMESEIATYNKLILKLEESEVFQDNLFSPYVECEYYKKKVLSIYKELCKLTKTESVKHKRVRLKVAPGHPEGPVKCLEDFINKNLDEQGNLPFPDLHDVVMCVTTANVIYNMGWSKAEIEKEARALFIHYGRTVQKWRQKREWRHLMLYVKEEAPDPADEDLALQARLEENARIAKFNEQDLLNRYAQMESSNVPDQNLNLSIEYNEGTDADSDYGSASPNPNVPATSAASSDHIARMIMNSFNINCNDIVYPTTIPVSVTNSESAELGSNTTSTNDSSKVIQAPSRTCNNAETSRGCITDILQHSTCLDRTNNYINGGINPTDNSELNVEVNTTKDKPVCNDSTNVNIACLNNTNNTEYRQILTDNSEVLNNYEVVKNCIVLNNGEMSDDEGTSQPEDSVLVKREPLDIPRMLEELGNNYTATIIDIEDPFLVIEISDSSDYESEEDC